MPINRYFSTSDQLTGDELTHLKVTRPRVGDHIELIDGQGTLSQAEIISLERHSAQLTILSTTTAPPPPPLILAQAIPRANRLDTILEKCTELGVTAFWFFPGDRGEKRRIPIERARRLILSATKQCGRLYLPDIQLKPPLLEWESIPHPAYFGDLNATEPPSSRPMVFIGPESGFSDRELTYLKEHDARGVSLNRHILRTDTAAIVAIALLASA